MFGWAAAVVAVTGVGVGLYAARGVFAHPPAASSAATSVASALAPSLSSGPPADPFAGSPADGWANGASGIVVPAAKPLSGFSAAQVASAYASTRKLLIAADLDKPTLLGGKPDAFAALLTAQQRATFLKGLNTIGVDKGGYPLSTRRWLATFAPGSVKIIGDVIKVHGTMSARIAHESGTTALAIDVNYLFAYAIEPPGRPSDWMRVVDHHYGPFYFARWDDPGGPLEAWDQTLSGVAGLQCGTKDGYIHPDYPGLQTAMPAESGPAVDPYAPATDMPNGGAACGRSTGT